MVDTADLVTYTNKTLIHTGIFLTVINNHLLPFHEVSPRQQLHLLYLQKEECHKMVYNIY